MSIKVKGFLKDVGGASRVTKLREENFAKGSPIPDPKDPIRELADKLHPKHMVFKVVDIREASPSSRVFRFESGDGHIPVFQSGQYVNFRLKIGESVLSRPYTISSAPYEARGEHPFFEITVRRNVPYLVPDYLFENVKVGDELEGALPFGFFYYEPMRDSLKGLKLTILYGSVKANDIVLKDELAAIEAACPDIKVVHVLSDEPDWPGEKGFITREIIEKYSTPDCTYMFCGPLPMFRFIKKALDEMSVPVRRFRHDVVNNPADVSTLPGYPKGTEEKTFKITVVRGIHEDVIDRHPLPQRRVRLLPQPPALGRDLRLPDRRRPPPHGQGDGLVPRLLVLAPHRPQDQDPHHVIMIKKKRRSFRIGVFLAICVFLLYPCQKGSDRKWRKSFCFCARRQNTSRSMKRTGASFWTSAAAWTAPAACAALRADARGSTRWNASAVPRPCRRARSSPHSSSLCARRTTACSACCSCGMISTTICDGSPDTSAIPCARASGAEATPSGCSRWRWTRRGRWGSSA